MSTPCHALVYRDVKERVSLADACQSLAGELEHFLQVRDDESFLSAFLRAAEIETALTDSHQEPFLFTNLLARDLVGNSSVQAKIETAEFVLRSLKSPPDKQLVISRPEGFAFYGLHPLDYADVLNEIDLSGTQPIAVIGIRTIGLALGYVVVNSLIQGCGANREIQFFSVRPIGHPYDRRCEFDKEQQHRVLQFRQGRFFIVDEGPGLSGSSFLSVGEALAALGVKHEQITFLCSRNREPEQLVTPSGAERWRNFKTVVVPNNHGAPRATTDEVFEYQGLGHYGDAVRRRINALATAGFTTHVSCAANGFSRAVAVRGRRLSQPDLSSELLDRMAHYLACRVRLCGVPLEAVCRESLANMARFNFLQAIGRELPSDFALPLERPVVADAQMMPHTWLQPSDGPLLKLDCGTHGDNHFYPGPVDIAWDVAGAIVEWQMNEKQRDYFIAHYNESANDNVNARLEPYIAAYAAFRNGYCRMAASSMAHEPAEQARLLRDAERYRCVLAEQIRPVAAAAAYE
jgi:hypothetical protein